MGNSIKNLLKSTIELCDCFNKEYNTGDTPLRDIMEMDILKYLLYIGLSDRKLTQEEADFISEYLDWHMPIPQWYKFVKNLNISGDSFLSDVPISFKVFIDPENKLSSIGIDVEDSIDTYIFLFEELGKLFVESTNNVNQRKQIALEKYITMLRKFYEDNSKRTNSINRKEIEAKDGNLLIELENRTIVIPQALPETIKRMKELVSLRDDMLKHAEQKRDRYDPDDINCSSMSCYGEIYDQLNRYQEIYEKKLNK